MTVSKRPTLKTISELTGFAVPTISRALSDAPDIGAETKATVRKVAREIGYVPNKAGVRLKTGKTNVISLVLTTDPDVMNHLARLISSIAGSLRDTSYQMIVTPYFPEEDPLEPVRTLVEAGSVDAVILNRIQPKDPRVAFLMARNFPFATHGRTDWCDQHSYYDYDNGRYARIAIAELAKRGRKNILIVAPGLDQTYAQWMLECARNEAEEQGVTLRLLETATSDDTTVSISAALRVDLQNSPDTDAICCGSANAAMGGVVALEDCGRVLGQDIDIFAKEAVRFLDLFRPEILAVREDIARAGQFLAKAAMNAVETPEAPPLQGLDFPKFHSLN